VAPRGRGSRGQNPARNQARNPARIRPDKRKINFTSKPANSLPALPQQGTKQGAQRAIQGQRGYSQRVPYLRRVGFSLSSPYDRAQRKEEPPCAILRAYRLCTDSLSNPP